MNHYAGFTDLYVTEFKKLGIRSSTESFEKQNKSLYSKR